MHNCKDDGSNHRSLCEDQSHNHTMPHTPFISPVIDSIRAIYSQKLMSSWRKQTAQRTKWIQKVENNNCVAVAVIWCEFSLLTRWRYTSLKKQQAKATAAVVVTGTATTNEEQEINFRVLRPSVCVRVHVSTLPRKKLNKTETNDNDGTKCNVDRIHLRMHMAQSYPTMTLTHKHNTQMKVKGIRNRYRICMSNI